MLTFFFQTSLVYFAAVLHKLLQRILLPVFSLTSHEIFIKTVLFGFAFIIGDFCSSASLIFSMHVYWKHLGSVCIQKQEISESKSFFMIDTDV